MSDDMSVAIPTTVLDDGRQFISGQDCMEYPWVLAFVRRFNNYWTRHENGNVDGYVSPHPKFMVEA